MTDHNRSVIKLLLVLMIWASSYSITRAAVEDLPPVCFAFLRHLVASLVLLTTSYVKRDTIKKPAGNMKWPVFILALTGVTLFYIFFNTSLVHTPAATGALIQGFMPIGIVVLAAVFLKETLSVYKVAGIVLSVTGVVLIGFIGHDRTSSPDGLLGPSLMVVSVVLWCIYTILARKYASVDPLWLTTRITITGTLLLLPATIIELWGQSIPAPSWQAWAAILFMGTFASALSYLWYSSALRYISASQAGTMLNLDPLMGAVIAIIFLDEPIQIIQIVGAGLVIAGVVLSRYRNSVAIK